MSFKIAFIAAVLDVICIIFLCCFVFFVVVINFLVLFFGNSLIVFFKILFVLVLEKFLIVMIVFRGNINNCFIVTNFAFFNFFIFVVDILFCCSVLMDMMFDCFFVNVILVFFFMLILCN